MRQLALTNEYAPEHLIIETKDYMEVGRAVLSMPDLYF